MIYLVDRVGPLNPSASWRDLLMATYYWRQRPEAFRLGPEGLEMKTGIRHLDAIETGVTAIEYCLVALLIAVAIATAVTWWA